MTLSDTLATILRRWYVVLLGFLVTCGLGWATYANLPPQYDAQGSILLMPADSTVGDEGNPFLYLGGMNDALDVLTRRSNATDVKEEVLANYDGATYTAERDSFTQSPVIVATVSARSADDVLRLLDDVLATLRTNLADMQVEQDIPPERQIFTVDLVIDEEAVQESKTALQLTLVVLGAGFIVTLMVTGLIDNALTRGGRDRRAHRAADDHGDRWAADTAAVPASTATEPRPEGELLENESVIVSTGETGSATSPIQTQASLDRQPPRVAISVVDAVEKSELDIDVLEPQRP